MASFLLSAWVIFCAILSIYYMRKTARYNRQAAEARAQAQAYRKATELIKQSIARLERRNP